MNTSATPRDIRVLGSEDLPALLDLLVHLHGGEEPAPDRTAAEEPWRELVSSPQLFCFGGHENRVLVSSCTLAVIPNLTRGCRPYGLIENVITHRDFRNKGWGKAILTHALNIAWKRRCYKVMLMTGRKDQEITRFYEGAGFVSNDKQAYVARRSAA